MVGFELLPEDGFVPQAIQIYFQLSFTDADALFSGSITAQSVGWVWSGIRERLTSAEAQTDAEQQQQNLSWQYHL